MLKRLRNIRRGVRVAFCCSICGSVPAVREARLFITADTGTWDTRLFLSLSLFFLLFQPADIHRRDFPRSFQRSGARSIQGREEPPYGHTLIADIQPGGFTRFTRQ